MANALPILLLGAGALLVLGKKKKAKKGAASASSGALAPSSEVVSSGTFSYELTQEDYTRSDLVGFNPGAIASIRWEIKKHAKIKPTDNEFSYTYQVKSTPGGPHSTSGSGWEKTESDARQMLIKLIGDWLPRPIAEQEIG